MYAKTEAEVYRKLRAEISRQEHGVAPVPMRGNVAAFLAEWLEEVKQHRRPRTFESYSETVERYIAPHIGTIVLAKLTDSDVKRMLAKLTARGDLSPTTVRYAYSVLRIALGRALKMGRVPRNVCVLVDPPSKARTEMHPLSADQARTFLASLGDDRLGPLYTLAIATGLRQGELLALRWADVVGDSILVAHSLQRGTREIADTKTDRSRRKLALRALAVAALDVQRERQESERTAAGRKWQEHGLVFTTRIGTALDGIRVTRSLQAALERAGLPRQRFHDLRHAYATLMLEAGEDLATVSKSLGHSNFSTTVDVYAHRTDSMARKSAERMDTILGGARG